MVVLVVTQTTQGQVSFHSIGFLPDGVESSIHALSGDGRVAVGYSGTGLGAPIRWTAADGLQALEMPPGATDGRAYDASFNGDMIVGQVSLPGRRASTLWTSGAYQELPGIPGTFGYAGSISGDGSVIAGTDFMQGPYRWTAAGGYQSLGSAGVVQDISSDGSVIVGDGAVVDGGGFRWTSTDGLVSLGALPDTWNASYPNAASADGSVLVGRVQRGSASFVSRAFRWTEALGYQLLPEIVPDAQTFALDVSADGGTVVGSTLGIPGGGACIWYADGSSRLLSDLFSELGLDLGGMSLIEATAISADGLTIAGRGINPDGRFEGWVAHIPAPGAGSALIFGCLALARRRRTQQPM